MTALKFHAAFIGITSPTFSEEILPHPNDHLMISEKAALALRGITGDFAGKENVARHAANRVTGAHPRLRQRIQARLRQQG